MVRTTRGTRPTRLLRVAVATLALVVAGGVPAFAQSDGATLLDFTDAQLPEDGILSAGDFSGDGIDDLLLTWPGRDNDVRWYGTDEDEFLDQGAVEFDIRGDYFPQLAGDFDGDGDDDLWLVRPGEDNDRMLLSDGNDSFTNLGGDSFDLSGTYDVSIVEDFDGDGRDDVWLHDVGPGNDRLLTSLGANAFRNHGRESFDVAGRYDWITPGDFSGDGRADLWLYREGRGNDRMLTSTGRNAFRNHGRNSFDVANEYLYVESGDFTGDGKDDLVLVGPTLGSDRRFNSFGVNEFRTPGSRSWQFRFGFYFMMPGDYDGDGREDLYVVGDVGEDRVLTSKGYDDFIDHDADPDAGGTTRSPVTSRQRRGQLARRDATVRTN